MKKILTVVLLLAMSLGMIGCSSTSKQSVAITKVESVGEQMQVDKTYPLEGPDDTLVINSYVTFKGYKDQGIVYISKEGVDSFDMYVNGHKVDASKMSDDKADYSIDISNVTINGENEIRIMNVKTTDGSLRVRVPYPVVIDGTPGEVGINQKDLDFLYQLIDAEVAAGFPGGQLVVIKDGKMVVNKQFGYTNNYLPDGTPIPIEDRHKVQNDTLYDLASNSKMYATNYAIQKLVYEKKLDINTKISDLYPEFKDAEGAEFTGKSTITIRHLLEHQAGFPGDVYFYNENYRVNEGDTENLIFSVNKSTTLSKILITPLAYNTGTKTTYSDLDYMLLGYIVEDIVGMPLDEYVEKNIYQPMGLKNVVFNPLDKGFEANNIGATELNGNTRDGAREYNIVRKYTLQGEVHDEKAFYSLQGVGGHAGLFASSEDLGKLAQVMINGGGYGENKYFDNETIDLFTKPKDSNSTYGLGWRRQADDRYEFYFSPEATRNTIGHTGWTGTLTVIDPENDLVIIWSTNKINAPVVDPEKNENYFMYNHFFGATYGAIPTMIYQSLGESDSALYPDLIVDLVDYKVDIMAAKETYQNTGDDKHLEAILNFADSYLSKGDSSRKEIYELIKDLKLDEELVNKFK